MYDILVVDPPWPRKKGGLRSTRPNQGRTLDYPTLSLSVIGDLLDKEILPKAASTHCLFLWGIDKFLLQGEQLLLDRGYKLHARMVWDKTNGIAPAFTIRFSHEYISWFYKPTLLPVTPRGKHRSVIVEPSRQHSRKPDAFYALIDSLYPGLKKLDVFSREKRKGWSQWGNQPNHFPSK